MSVSRGKFLVDKITYYFRLQSFMMIVNGDWRRRGIDFCGCSVKGKDDEISRYHCNLMGFVFAFQTFDSKPIQTNYSSFLLWARTTKRNERSLSAVRIVMALRRIRFSFSEFFIPPKSEIEDFYSIASCDTHTHYSHDAVDINQWLRSFETSLKPFIS